MYTRDQGGHEAGDHDRDVPEPQVHGDMRFAAIAESNRSQHSASIRLRRPTKRRKRSHTRVCTAVCALLATSAPAVMAQTCVSLADSTACPAFNASSISTDSALVGLFSFLSSVTDTASFDSGIQTYIANGFTQLRYVDSHSVREPQSILTATDTKPLSAVRMSTLTIPRISTLVTPPAYYATL